MVDPPGEVGLCVVGSSVGPVVGSVVGVGVGVGVVVIDGVGIDEEWVGDTEELLPGDIELVTLGIIELVAIPGRLDEGMGTTEVLFGACACDS